MEPLYAVIDPSPADGDRLAGLVERLQPRSRILRTAGVIEMLEEIIRLRVTPSMLFTAFETADLNAIELLGALRERRWLAATPVAVVSEPVGDRTMVQTYRLGAAVFLEKPIAIHELREAIREHSHGAQWMTAASVIPAGTTEWRRAA
jgi:DNA-binding NtrC family response regulator